MTAKRIEIDHRTDIFSLGVVMYEMLALVRPFDGDTTHQIAENIVMRDPPDLRKIKSRVPRDLAVICGKALEKLKDARFQTMAEFAADLRLHLGNEPIHAQPPTLLDRSVKWVRRNPTKSLVGAVATAAFVVISGLAIHISRQKAHLETANSALEVKTAEAQENSRRADVNAAEAEANAAEAQENATEAKRQTTDVLRLSLAQDYDDLVVEADALWPARPEKILALESWISEARELVGELPALKSKQAELRALAIPLTKDEVCAERESHPDFEALASLRAELQSKRSALAVRRGEKSIELPTVDWSEYPSGADELDSLAWPMVCRDPKHPGFGEEGLGVVLARGALKLASDAERASILLTVAEGLFELGDDEGALRASRDALEAAPEDELEEYADRLSGLEARVSAAASTEGQRTAAEELVELESDLAILEARVNERRTWVFLDSDEQKTRARWWHNTLDGLIGKLESLVAPETGLMSPGGVSELHGWSMARRLKSALLLRDGFGPGGEYLVRWERDLPAIQAAYPGLDLPVQMGLVPIGADSASKLWEFWHVESGTEPLRGADGVLDLEESSGLVLVLLPGGKFWMGAQSTDPDGQNYDEGADSDESPVHEVELSGFFLSKYEMTQGQWKRLAGVNPSLYSPDGNWGTSWNRLGLEATLLEPVEQVSWYSSVTLLDRFGLKLPSEAQWEYGARGGTEAVWWSGSGKESLQGVANLVDKYASENGGESWTRIEDWLDDGYTFHAPVNTMRANGFGLHNVHGNVWERCLDEYDVDFYRRSSGVDPVNPATGSARRVNRGGSFNFAACEARSALRSHNTPHFVAVNLGLRPAQGITSFSFTTSPTSNR